MLIKGVAGFIFMFMMIVTLGHGFVRGIIGGILMGAAVVMTDDATIRKVRNRGGES